MPKPGQVETALTLLLCLERAPPPGKEMDTDYYDDVFVPARNKLRMEMKDYASIADWEFMEIIRKHAR